MLIDNSAVEAANEAFIRGSPDAMRNVSLCYAAVDLLRAAAELPSFSAADDVTVLRLAIRLINDAGACGTCALGGYYQQAAAHIRDIVDVEFLLDLFRRVPTEINRWRVCDEKARRKNFSASAMRDRLDALDGLQNKSREALYNLFSTTGTHANPNGFQVGTAGRGSVAVRISAGSPGSPSRWRRHSRRSATTPCRRRPSAR